MISNLKLRAAISGALLLCLLALGVSAQPPQRPQFDPLRGLKHALEEAGAPALSTQQEEQLKTLIQQFRDARGNQQPDANLRAAQQAYDAAILAGNTAAANQQAQAIATALAAHTAERLQADAAFKIQVLNVIKSNQQQYNALVQKFGTTGVVRLLGSLAGGPGGFGGPGGPGHGPGRFGGPGGPGGGADDNGPRPPRQ